jgi:alpha-tubulin suppressor-like RCC1 family protein
MGSNAGGNASRALGGSNFDYQTPNPDENSASLSILTQDNVEQGPPPDMAKRHLIFDSMFKIITRGGSVGSPGSGFGTTQLLKDGSATGPSASAAKEAKEARNKLPLSQRGTYVWSWGAGYHGQLGGCRFARGQPKYATVPRRVEITVPIRQIACGALHSAALTDDGNVYTWGDARSLQLGYTPKCTTNQQVPALVEALKGTLVVRIALGQGHTLALTDKGRLFSWGSSKFGQCGHGDRQRVDSPREIAITARFVDISCGDRHSAAVSETGTLYTWGCGDNGQLGHGRQKYDAEVRPRPVSFFADEDAAPEADLAAATGMATGVDAWVDPLSSFTTSSSAVSSFTGFGPNASAAATAALAASVAEAAAAAAAAAAGGNASPRGDVAASASTLPTPLPLRIAQVSCGAIHTAVVAANGHVYVFGFGEHLLPSTGPDAPCFAYRPLRVPVREPAIQVASGQAHVLALTAKGDVYAWGSGTYGQLGHGIAAPLRVPRLVLLGKAIAQIAAGRYHSVAVTAFGTLYTWGCGENGQLGHGADESTLVPRVVEALTGSVAGQVACGEHHTVTLAAAPCSRIDQETALWIAAEREEFAMKLSAVRHLPHGLTRAELVQTGSAIAELRQHWGHGMAALKTREADEFAADCRALVVPAEAAQSTVEEISAQEQAGYWAGNVAPEKFGPMHDYFEGVKRDRYGAGATAAGATAGGLGAGGRPFTAPHDAAAGAGAGGKNFSLGPAGHRPQTAADGKHGGSGMQLPKSSLGTGQVRAQFMRSIATLVTDMQSTAAGQLDAPADLQRAHDWVAQLRGEHDSLFARGKELAEAIRVKRAQLETEAAAMASGGNAEAYKKSEEVLNMKLNTVQIKVAETDQNQRNYRLNIAHLKEEELHHYHRLHALRLACAENDAALRRMNEIRLHSLVERDRAETELQSFQGEVKQYQNFMRQQLDSFASIHAVSQRVDATRARATAQRREQEEAKARAKISALETQMLSKQQDAANMSQHLAAVRERLAYFKARFQQIVTATGLDDPDAIVNKFRLKEDIRNELQTELEEKERRIRELALRERQQQDELKRIRAAHQDVQWREVDHESDKVRARAAQASKTQEAVDAIAGRLALVQEGMLALLSKLPTELSVEVDRDPDALTVLAPAPGYAMNPEYAATVASGANAQDGASAIRIYQDAGPGAGGISPRKSAGAMDFDAAVTVPNSMALVEAGHWGDSSAALSLPQDRALKESGAQLRVLHTLRLLDSRLGELKVSVHAQEVDHARREDEDRERARIAAEQAEVAERLRLANTVFHMNNVTG